MESVDALHDKVAEKLQNHGIETRNLFYPLHEIPPYQKYANLPYPVSSAISRRGLSLPSSVKLSEEDIVFITQKIKKAIS
jgi:perosamine synthetase